MKKINILIVSFIFIMAAAFAYSQTGMGKQTTADEVKNICLTCHVTQGVMSMFGFKAYLGAINHLELDDHYYTHPEDCIDCHNGQWAEDFSTLVHRGHLVDKEGRIMQDGNNHFAILYGGQCTHCHKINANGTFSMPGMESLFKK